MNLDVSLLKKYSLQIKNAEDFFESKRSKDSRAKNAWTGDSEYYLKITPNCPTCGDKMTEDSLSREHIHPLVLGGKEKPYNVVPMCKSCNLFRNEIMEKYVGGNKVSTLRKRWPLNRDPIIKFLIWSHATANNDIEDFDREEFTGLNKEFAKLRGIDPITRSKPKAWFSSLLDKVLGKNNSNNQELLNSKKQSVACDFCDVELSIPSNHAGEFICPACEQINNTDKTSTVKSPEIDRQEKKTSQEKDKFSLEDWIEGHWKGLEKGKECYVDLKLAIMANEAKNNGDRNLRDILFEDHNISKNYSVEKIVKYLDSLSHKGFQGDNTIRNNSVNTGANRTAEVTEVTEVTDVTEVNEIVEIDETENYIDKFRMTLLRIIGNNKYKYDKFIEQIKHYMVENDFQSPTPTLFLNLFDLPKGLKKQILNHAADLVIITHLSKTLWEIEIRKEHLIYHSKLEELISLYFESKEHKEEGLSLDDFWKMVKSLKEEFNTSWAKFMRVFGMSEKGGMIFKSRSIISMLNIELEIRETEDKKKSLYLR